MSRFAIAIFTSSGLFKFAILRSLFNFAEMSLIVNSESPFAFIFSNVFIIWLS